MWLFGLLTGRKMWGFGWARSAKDVRLWVGLSGCFGWGFVRALGGTEMGVLEFGWGGGAAGQELLLGQARVAE